MAEAAASAQGDLLRGRAEQLSATLPALLVEANRVAATVSQGVHGRRRVGSGETFWQFRRYQTGDPVSAIDWRQSAKRIPIYIRQNEWEAAQSVWLWADASASMDYHSDAVDEAKLARAHLLLLALASLLARAGEQFGLLDRESVIWRGRSAMDRLTESLLRNDISSTDGLPQPAQMPRYAQTVWFGDFLAPLDETEARIRYFAGQCLAGHLVQILDPAEEDLPFKGRTHFEGLEGEGRYLVGRTESLRDEYRNTFAARQAALRAMTRSVGWTFISHRTDRPPQSAMLALYRMLTERVM